MTTLATTDNVREISTPLLNAQLAHVAKMCNDTIATGYSDDGYDYLSGALELANRLLGINYECDADGFNLLMNPTNISAHPDEFVMLTACDGVCPEIYQWLDANEPGWETTYHAMWER